MKELDQARRDLARLREPVDIGTRDRPRRVARLDLTLDRLDAWRLDRVPNLANDAPRGGSSSPTEVTERKADDRTTREAVRDARAIAEHLAAIVGICARYTVPVDITPEIGLAAIPGCKSCARPQRGPDGKKQPGHFSPVADRYRSRQLCRWCGEFYAATHKYPPLEAVDLYHRVSPSAAGRWLTKNASRRR